MATKQKTSKTKDSQTGNKKQSAGEGKKRSNSERENEEMLNTSHDSERSDSKNRSETSGKRK